MRSPDIRHSLQLLCLVGTPCHQRRDLSEEHTGSVQGLCSYFSIHQSPPGLLGLGRRETGNTPSAEDRATLGSDPSADWSPANGRSGGSSTLISIYEKLAKDNPLLRQLNAAVEYGQVMPNIPQMGRFFSSVSGALQIATQGRASAQAALQEAEANMRPD